MAATANGPDLEQARETLELLMDDECKITRPSDDGHVLDPNTGEVTSEAAEPVFTGPCLVSKPSVMASIQERAGEYPAYIRQRISVPMTANEVLKGDIVEIIASRRDPHMVGEVWRVESVMMSTFALKQTLLVEQP